MDAVITIVGLIITGIIAKVVEYKVEEREYKRYKEEEQ